MLVLVVAVLSPVAALAVDGDPDALAISSARVADHPEVSLTVNAPQREIGDDVPDTAFALTENGEVRDLEVRRLDSDDLEVALVMDASGSMEGAPLEAARAAGLAFVDSMPPGVAISVVEFSTEAALVSGFTTDRDETSAAITGLTSGAWTAMYDALHLAMDVFDDRDSDRQAIVLLTDGGDNRSQATLEETVERLAEGDDVLHIVELITVERPVPRERVGRDDPGIDEIDLAALGSLADAAGQGFVVSPQDLDAISTVYEEIAATLMNQYELSYTSEAYDQAEVVVRIDHEGASLAGAIEVDLPPDPAAAESPTEQDTPADEADDAGEADEAAADGEGSGDLAVDEPGEDRWAWIPGADRPWVLPLMLAVLVGGFAFTVYFIVQTVRGY